MQLYAFKSMWHAHKKCLGITIFHTIIIYVYELKIYVLTINTLC